MTAHLANKLARRIGPRLERVCNLAASGIANPQLIFVNVSIVNSVNGEATQNVVVHKNVALVMLEPEGFEEILIDDDSPGGNDRLHQRHDVVFFDFDVLDQID